MLSLCLFPSEAFEDLAIGSDANEGEMKKKRRARRGGCTTCTEILAFLVSDRFGPLIEVSCSAEQMAVSPSLVPPRYGGGQQDGTRW